MGIFSRLTDIINSNLNALLEKAEDPEKIVRLVIQEMEDTLVEVRSAAARAIADKKERQRRVQWLEQEIIDWERKAELALEKGREDLAKAALIEKGRLAVQVDVLKKELSTIEQQLDKLSDDISKLQAKLTDAKNRQHSITVRHKTAQSQLRVRSQLHEQRVEDILMRFETAERRIDAMESEAESYEVGRRRGLSEEIDDLMTSEQIDEELQALKARVSKESKSTKSKSEPKSD